MNVREWHYKRADALRAQAAMLAQSPHEHERDYAVELGQEADEIEFDCTPCRHL